jgi:broad specificity polyphosphatase/5'/3'-nucleotidase SurE
MKLALMIALFSTLLAVCGCTTEKTPAPQQKLPAITLSAADKEQLIAFQKEIISVESLTDKVVKLAVDELKNVIKGGDISINLPSIIDKAKAECLLAGKSLAQKKVPETLSPELKGLLHDGKVGLIAAYKAYEESFDTIKGFIVNKNPMALFLYRKQNEQAQKLYTEAADKINRIMAAGGVTK